VGLWNFIEKIAKGTFNTAVQSVDFVTDIAQEALPGRDEYEGSGVADTIWGSFNDNILGEGGAMQSAIGPEGVGGTIIGAIPETVRKPMKSVIDPTFKAVQVAYKQAIDRPLNTAMTMAGVADASGEGWLEGKKFEGGFSNWFDTDTWGDAWEISQSQSLGQAMSLAVGTKNLLDEGEVERWEGTSLHNLMSGTIDATYNIVFDPFYQVGVPLKRGYDISKHKRTFGNPEKHVNTSKFLKWNDELNKLDDALDGSFSEGFRHGLRTADDQVRIDTLAGQIFRKFGKSKQLTPELASALAAAPTLEARQMLIRLAMGDGKALQTVINGADEWANLLQSGGIIDELAKAQARSNRIQAEIIRASKPVGKQSRLQEQVLKHAADNLARLEDEARALLQSVPMSEATMGVFDIAYTLKQERLRALAPQFADEMSYDANKAIFEAMNESPNLVSAVADEMLDPHIRSMLGPLLTETPTVNRMMYNSLREAPQIGIVEGLGYGAASFLKEVPLLGTYGVRAVNVFVEKTPQQMMIWDDVDQTFNQFERMLRDAGRVTRKADDGTRVSLTETAGVNIDEALGQWVRAGLPERKLMFNKIVDDLNDGVIKLFEEDLAFKAKDGRTAAQVAKESLTNRPLTKARMRAALNDAEGTLRGHAETARVMFDNRGLRFNVADTDFNITSRFVENLTPQQLRQASIVPRYDAIATVMEHSRLQRVLGRTAELGDEVMMAWKKSVLLRPAWPIRVLSDEMLRSAAALGAMHSMRGVFQGFGDLRTAWFKKGGQDPMPAVIAAMRKEVDVVPRPTGWAAKLDDGDLIREYELRNGANATDKLTRKTIGELYGKSRIRRRRFFTTGLGLWALGPGGALASAALYTLYARRTMASLARREVAATFYDGLRRTARKELNDATAGIKASVAAGVRTENEATQLIEELTRRTELLETQGRTLQRQIDHTVPRTVRVKDKDFTAKYDLPEEYSDLLMNFDRVGQLMHEARVGGFMLGGYRFSNQFGDTPLAVELQKKMLSSSRSTRGAYESVARTGKGAYREAENHRLYSYDGEARSFNDAYNHALNRQFKPHLLDDAMPSEFQTYTQLFWLGRSDAEIVAWLQAQKGAGSRLADAMPRHFKEGNIEQWVAHTRKYMDELVPDLPQFQHLRARLARGSEVQWDEIVQILKDDFGSVEAGVQAIRAQGFSQFGVVHGSGGLLGEAVQVKGITNRITNKIDSWMDSLGTMTVDNLSRSTVFAGVYRKEVARLMDGYRIPDGSGYYRLTPKDLKSIETAARRTALGDTRNLLYDLAERTRFGDMVGVMMPFYNAWQEVITRWSGLAVQNPVFVARGLRYFQAIKGEDENGDSQFVIRMPEGLLGAEIAGKKVFGNLGTLGFTSLKLHPDSVSMLSAGLPGFGPVVAIAASESVVAQPSLQGSLEWMLPYGASEGTSVVGRILQQVEPTFLRRLEGAYFDTAERQKMLAQVSIDLAAQYEGNGIEIDTPELEKEFVDEAIRRTEDILKIRALAGLGIPFAFQVQSPYHAVIEEYRKVTEKDGFDAATTWLLENHPELWAITARRTMVQGVASATLEGDAKYREHKAFADAHPEIGDFIIGKIGADDVQFEFNYAVYKSEIAEGRRVRATPQEILRKPQENKGWAEWRNVKSIVYEELERREAAGGSASLGAKANNDLQMIMDQAKLVIAQDNPGWWEAYNESYDQLRQAKVMDGFRALIKSEDFQYRPEIPLLDEYFEARGLIEKELERRGNESGEADAYSLGYRTNADLKQLWDAIRVTLRNNNDFVEIFDRYFENDDIDKKTWASR
jgi:hypothetical protein